MFASALIALSLSLSASRSDPFEEHLHAHPGARQLLLDDQEKKGQAKQPSVYDEQADGRLQIAAALAKAKRNHRRVLIQWGANWCSWCLLLDKTFEKDAKVKHELLYEYDLVHIDIGRFDKHMDLVEGYGFELKGVPHLTILDGDGKLVAQVDTTPLEEKQADGSNGHSAERVLAMLKKHRAARVDAKVLLKTALQAARSQKKRVFLTFGAPW